MTYLCDMYEICLRYLCDMYEMCMKCKAVVLELPSEPKPREDNITPNKYAARCAQICEKNLSQVGLKPTT